MGLKNSGADISMKVATAIEARREELINRKHKTDIKITPIEQNTKAVSSEEVDDLKRQLAEMQDMMAKIMAGKAADKEPAKKGATVKK